MATITTNTTAAAVSPVSFADALTAQGKGTAAKDLFARAYEWGNKQTIPMEALQNVWPASPIATDKVTSYLDSVYFIQYCALQYWEDANTPAKAETWRKKGMDAWGTILEMIGCDFKRDVRDWLYLVSRATLDGKASKESTSKVVKPTSKAAYRKRVEMLAGMALAGFAFTNPLETLEKIEQTRKAKADAKAAKDANKKAKEEKPATVAPAEEEKPATTKARDKQPATNRPNRKKKPVTPPTSEATPANEPKPTDTIPADNTAA